MSDPTLGVCIVGCGDMGTKHAERWSHVPDVRVVAVADIIESRARRMAERFGLDRWFEDYHAAVALPQVNVVSVCVPTRDHAKIAIWAAQQGKHVLCEKPMALTLAQAEAMDMAARQHGVRLGLGFMRRYSPMVSKLRDWLAQGHLGRPLLYQATDIREIRPKREMHDARANGGPVIDMGVHLFDSWRYLFASKPVSVSASGLQLAASRGELAHIVDIAYDTASVTVRYASGDVGVFVVCWGLPPGITPPGLADQVVGPKGMLRVSYGITDQAVHCLGNNQAWHPLFASDQDMYQLEIEAFARSVRENHSPLTSAEDGRAALQVALAALKSVQSGQTIYFSEGAA